MRSRHVMQDVVEVLLEMFKEPVMNQFHVGDYYRPENDNDDAIAMTVRSMFPDMSTKDEEFLTENVVSVKDELYEWFDDKHKMSNPTTLKDSEGEYFANNLTNEYGNICERTRLYIVAYCLNLKAFIG